MKVIGIICEYNPFHNGHIYHLNKIKELYPDSLVILVMSTCFTEHSDISIINKWDKTKIALNHNVDLVIELPTIFSINSSDYFAKGAITILNYLKCDYLVFGSETNNIDELNKLVDIQINNKKYDSLVKKYLDMGLNYPTSMSKVLSDLTNTYIKEPNDLLAISYLKQIKLLNSKMKPIAIQRTNNYHDQELKNEISSATSIRKAFNDNIDISKYMPIDALPYLIKVDYQRVFTLLKYKILSEDLSNYLDISEGIDNKIKKVINETNNLDELINKVKSKRYTYARIKRILLHILLGVKKDDLNNLLQINYIRVLGFNTLGKKYIKDLKKDLTIPIITNYSNINDNNLDYELKINMLYNYLINHEELNIIEKKSIPIDKK